MNLQEQAEKMTAAGEKVPAKIKINIAKKDFDDAIRVTTKGEFLAAVTGNDVTLQVDQDTKFERIENFYWQTLAYANSVKVTSEDLGVAFMFETPK